MCNFYRCYAFTLEDSSCESNWIVVTPCYKPVCGVRTRERESKKWAPNKDLDMPVIKKASMTFGHLVNTPQMQNENVSDYYYFSLFLFCTLWAVIFVLKQLKPNWILLCNYTQNYMCYALYKVSIDSCRWITASLSKLCNFTNVVLDKTEVDKHLELHNMWLVY